eukprot:scaffold664809_cov41-Prasinocladus_malaysianus.AAC.1
MGDVILDDCFVSRTVGLYSGEGCSGYRGTWVQATAAAPGQQPTNTASLSTGLVSFRRSLFCRIRDNDLRNTATGEYYAE